MTQYWEKKKKSLLSYSYIVFHNSMFYLKLHFQEARSLFKMCNMSQLQIAITYFPAVQHSSYCVVFYNWMLKNTTFTFAAVSTDPRAIILLALFLFLSSRFGKSCLTEIHSCLKIIDRVTCCSPWSNTLSSL